MFTVRKFTSIDKIIRIDGPGDLKLSVDYDDVDTEAVERAIPHILDALNTYWQGNGRTNKAVPTRSGFNPYSSEQP